MIMKKLIAVIAFALVATCPSVIAQNNLENDPAYLDIDKAFDFKTIKPEVNINLPKFLLKDALADLDGGEHENGRAFGKRTPKLAHPLQR